MRVLAVIALAMVLAGCEGDRIKQSKGDAGIAWSYNVDANTIGRLKASVAAAPPSPRSPSAKAAA